MRPVDDDELAQMLRATNPVADEAAPGPDDPAGLRIRARVLGLRRSRLRRWVAIPAVGLAMAGASAATVVWVTGSGSPASSEAVGCHIPADWLPDASLPDDMPQVRQMVMVGEFNAAKGDPVETCRDLVADQGGSAQDPMTACVNQFGGLAVWPGGTETCAEHNGEPFTGLTEEQQRYAEFRLEIDNHLEAAGCLPFGELERYIEERLAEYGYTGWTVDHHADDPEDQCYDDVFFSESTREIVASALR